MALQFMSREWVEAARDALNAGPSEEIKAKKLEKFWTWIEEAKERVNCQLALAVEGLPGDRPDCVVMDLEKGVCTEARLASRSEAEQSATYMLSGSFAAWQEIMGGYDMGKTIMYRKLRLTQGELLEFFRAAYYWTESLACIQRIPTSF